MNGYRRNHYVPEWYQRRFFSNDQKENKLFYLDLKPDSFRDPRGVSHKYKDIYWRGPENCFKETDLYTIKFGLHESTQIEEKFFGSIDRQGSHAVREFSEYAITPGVHKSFNDMVMFMSSQKLRTPKGLNWLIHEIGERNRILILGEMVRLRAMFCATWVDCIWQIADAVNSDTKFIISDHPVTVYNRACGPQWCKRHGDPDIRLNGTHTIFPLSLNKVLILTNLSWVRNPYQSGLLFKPNPALFRNSLFNMLDVQVDRKLEEQEVREINFIIKNGADRYVAGAEKEWLYPEKYVSKSNWNMFGDGYLLMPDPRSVQYGGETIIGYSNGSEIFDAYRRRPWNPEFGKEGKDRREFDSLYRFKGDFARKFGPKRRGRSFEPGKLEPEIDSDEYHKYHLSLTKNKR